MGLDNWTWGLSLIALTIAIHMTGVTFLVSVLHGFRVRLESRSLGLARVIAIVVAAFTAMGLLLAVLHGIEAALWAAAYLWLGALDSPGAAILYSVELDGHARRIGGDAPAGLADDGRAGGGRRHVAVRYQHGVHLHGDAVLLPTPCASRAPGRLRQSQISPDRSTRRRDKIGDQRAPDAAPAGGGIDEQILQIAYGLRNKGSLVQQRMGEAQQSPLSRGEPAQDRGPRRDDPSPSGGDDILGKMRLIKFRITAPKPLPLRFVGGTRRSDLHESLRLVVGQLEFPFCAKRGHSKTTFTASLGQ